MDNPLNQKPAPDAATLYVVATPIGNLEDISWRAIRILREVDLIACEDTRETLKLLTSYKIVTPCTSYHAKSTLGQEDKIIAQLQAGKSVALVSDRGTPGISDPGTRLIKRAIMAGIKVTPIPGAAAVIAALQASGAITDSFVYLGYLPHKKGRQKFLKMAIAEKRTVIFYESPHRLQKCLQQMVDQGVADRPVIVAREITKLHEQFWRGTVGELLAQLTASTTTAALKGEFVVILDAL